MEGRQRCERGEEMRRRAEESRGVQRGSHDPLIYLYSVDTENIALELEAETERE